MLRLAFLLSLLVKLQHQCWRKTSEAQIESCLYFNAAWVDLRIRMVRRSWGNCCSQPFRQHCVHVASLHLMHSRHITQHCFEEGWCLGFLSFPCLCTKATLVSRRWINILRLLIFNQTLWIPTGTRSTPRTSWTSSACWSEFVAAFL